ncbi:MAG TPA: 30S ribosomal protein S8 [Candidatus Saccharimonadales bacterium]|nr:30S ribosomal protein S8 [Candidatus Saccharimonadales bacterium]
MSMQSTDPIADMLTRIRNAILVGKSEVRLPSSKLKVTVAKELKKAGYLHDVKTEKGSPRDTLVITINQAGQNALINHVSRVSRPGRRVYSSAADIPRVKNGRGLILVSTSKGVMDGQSARKARLGGELICEVY